MFIHVFLKNPYIIGHKRARARVCVNIIQCVYVYEYNMHKYMYMHAYSYVHVRIYYVISAVCFGMILPLCMYIILPTYRSIKT